MFTRIETDTWSGSVFNTIGKQWMLITASCGGRVNTMTASWGGFGVLWNQNVATIYIRPQRYTREIVDEAQRFTLSFLPETYRAALTLCGQTSGRDGDKITKAGLRPVTDGELVYFEQAELVIACRKLYRQEMTPACFIDGAIDAFYPQKDYHIMYIGEIEQCLKNEDPTNARC